MKFKRTTKSTNKNRGGKELNMRNEFAELIFGGNGEIPHKKRLILRRFRKDDDGDKLPCSCLDEFTKEASQECKFCLGEGYFWDEEWVEGYSMFLGADSGLANRVRHLIPGWLRVDHKIFYLGYKSKITYDDKIIELKLDQEGSPVIPYVRQAIYQPQSIIELRADDGRLDFYEIACRELDAIREDP